eukprot:1215990-Rhodomonas_salina.1
MRWTADGTLSVLAGVLHLKQHRVFVVGGTPLDPTPPLILPCLIPRQAAPFASRQPELFQVRRCFLRRGQGQGVWCCGAAVAHRCNSLPAAHLCTLSGHRRGGAAYLLRVAGQDET